MGKLGQDFTHWKGNYRQIVFFIEDVESLAGYKAEWAFSENDLSPAIVTKSSEGVTPGITFSGQEVIVTILPADTSLLVPMDYYHELMMWDVDNKPSTPAIGKMTLKPVIL